MNEIVLLVLGIAGVLLLISLLPPLAQRLHVPDTVLLAALGSLLGLAIGLLQDNGAAVLGDRVMVDFLLGLDEIQLSSHLFLAVFLPILLFETALRTDGRALLPDVSVVLVMAVVAVVVTTVVAGGAVWAVSSLPLAAGLLVAAIIATTDPVAVVAVFREVGAPRRLTAMVEGESLLNDAAAIAVFAALLQIVKGNLPPDLPTLGLGFTWDFLGGAAFGALTGRLAATTLARLDAGGPAEVTMSVALAYLTYAIGEGYLGVSGVVAVVFAALVFGDAARARLSAAAWQAMMAIWGQVAYWASSLIFVLASMVVVPAALRDASTHDLLLLAALTAGALLARAVVLYGVLPLVLRGGEARGVRGDYKLVMLWGGLRGAVTLALALGVRDDPLVSDAISHVVSVVATGFVLFTLLVQATTLPWLIRRLGLDQLSPAERLLRQRALELVRLEVDDRLTVVAADYGIAPRVSEKPPAPTVAGDDVTREQLATALGALTRREIELCVERLARGLVSRRSGSGLVGEARALVDVLRSEGPTGYRMVAKHQSELSRATRWAIRLQRHTGIDRPLARLLAGRFGSLLVRREVLEQLVELARGRIAALFGERISETAARLVEARLLEAHRGLDALRLQYPEYWAALADRHLARVALRLEQDGLQRIAAEGLLSPEIERHLAADLRARERHIEAVPPLDLGLDVDRLVRQMPVFAELPPQRLQEISGLLTPRLVLPGERIIRRGRDGDSMFFIASGAVEVMLTPERPRLGTGDFFGELALLTGQPRGADVVALGYGQLLVLARDDFQQFLRAHPELVNLMRQIASERAGRELQLDL